MAERKKKTEEVPVEAAEAAIEEAVVEDAEVIAAEVEVAEDAIEEAAAQAVAADLEAGAEAEEAVAEAVADGTITPEEGAEADAAIEEAVAEAVAEVVVEAAAVEEAIEEAAAEAIAEEVVEVAAVEEAIEQAAAEEKEKVPPPPSGPKPKKKRLPRSQRPVKTRPTREKAAERRPIVRLEKPEHERGRSQERQGTVVSAAMDKTIVVKVDVIKSHRKYKKVVRRSVKFHAHDEGNAAKLGDVVRIVETRPLSATKRWRLTEIVEVAK
jgi:small subunit ribosomal protein S17